VRTIKLCSALCLGLGLIIVSTFSSFYWELYQRSVLFDTKDLTVAQDGGIVKQSAFVLLTNDKEGPFYDNCGDPVPVDATTEQADTKWSFVFRFNAIFYTVVTGMVMCSCTGLIYTRIFNATLNCLILAMVVHLATIILSGVYRFNAIGKLCAGNDTEYDTLGNSFESDAATFRKLFIAQCCLFVPFSLCACFGMKQGKELGPKNTDDDYVRDY